METSLSRLLVPLVCLLLAAAPRANANSFSCTTGDQVRVRIDVPSTAYHRIELSVAVSTGGTPRFSLAYPAFDSTSLGTGTIPFSVGSSTHELVTTLTGTSSPYTIALYRNPTGGSRGQIPQGSYDLYISWLASGATTMTDVTHAYNTSMLDSLSRDIINASSSMCVQTITLSPSSVPTPVEIGGSATISVATNYLANPPASLSYTDSPGAQGDALVAPDPLPGEQRTGSFTFTPTCTDYTNGPTFTFTFRAADKDNPALYKEASISITVANSPPVLTVMDTGDQVWDAGSGRYRISPGQTLQIGVSTADCNSPATLDSPVPSVTGGGSLGGSPTWSDAANGTGTYSYTATDADQGKQFTVSFSARDKDSGAPSNTETIAFVVSVLPASLAKSPNSFSPFTAAVGSSTDQSLTLSNRSITPLTVSLKQNTSGGTLGIEYAEGERGYYIAGLGDAPCAPVPSQSVSFNASGGLTVRYVPLTVGAVPAKSVTLVVSDGTTSTEIPLSLSGTGSQPVRDPSSIVAVLDKSGSMQADSETAGTRKYEALKESIRLFDQFMADVSVPSDRLGLLKYNQQPNLTDRITLGQYPAGDPAISAFIDRLDAAGTTSISRAAATAFQELIDEPGFPDPNRRSSVLLMTDGRHNTPTMSFGDDFTLEFPLIDPADLQNIGLNILGFGRSGDLMAGFLDDLTRGFMGQLPGGGTQSYTFKPGGVFRHTTDNKKLSLFFVQALLGDQFNAQVCVDDEGAVTLGSESVETLYVSRSSRRAVFYVTWSDPSVRLYFRLIAPNGAKVYKECRVGGSYSIASLAFPYRESGALVTREGAWKMMIFAIPTSIWSRWTDSSGKTNVENAIREAAKHGEAADAPSIAYEAALATEDPLVRAEFDIQGDDHFTGDELLLSAKLTDGGRPILGADDVTVKVSIPKESLGDFLYKNDLASGTAAQGTAADGSDAGDSAATQKLAALLQQYPNALQDAIIPFPMHDDGIDGDASAGDGIYTARIRTANGQAATEHNGVYSYKFRAGGRACDGSRFYRTVTMSEHIDSIPDAAHSTVSYYYISPTQAKVTMVLKDRFGHYLAPLVGRTHRIAPRSPEQMDFRQLEAVDTLNGEWIFTIESPQGKFRPYMDVDDLIETQVSGLGMPHVDLPVDVGRARAPLEFFASWSMFPFDSIQPMLFAGAHLRYPLGSLFSLDGEIAFAPSLPSAGLTTSAIQYAVGGGFDLPLLLWNSQPFIQALVGRCELFDSSYSSNGGAWQLTGAIGIRKGFSWRRDIGLSASVRNSLLLGLPGVGATYNLQIALGVYLPMPSR